VDRKPWAITLWTHVTTISVGALHNFASTTLSGRHTKTCFLATSLRPCTAAITRLTPVSSAHLHWRHHPKHERLLIAPENPPELLGIPECACLGTASSEGGSSASQSVSAPPHLPPMHGGGCSVVSHEAAPPHEPYTCTLTAACDTSSHSCSVRSVAHEYHRLH
jgi:hypothetical protein